MSTLQDYLQRGAGEMGLVLAQAQIEAFTALAEELCRWNRKINLTAITRLEEIAVKHFLDSLTILKWLNIDGELLDVGSGGGFPALPLKIVSPSTTIVSVDTVEKKILFQRHIARMLRLEKFTAVHARAENLGAVYPEKFNRIVSRAFSDISTFVQLSLPLLAVDGIIIAMKGKEGRSEAVCSANTLAAIGAVVMDIHEFQLPLTGEMRSLIIIGRKK